MVAVRPRKLHTYPETPVESVLYVGSGIDEFSNMVSRHIGQVEFHYKLDVEEALAISRERHFDVVIVDQRQGELATQLLIPLLANLSDPVKLVVISPLANIGQYLRVPGVARVLTAPLRTQQLLRVLGLNDAAGRGLPAPKATIDSATLKPQRKASLGQYISGASMTLVSNLYKKMAFLLLAVLFAAFCFYGILIGYFLISSNWAAPVTLGQGHELVKRVESELGDLRVNRNLVEQRISEAVLEAQNAERSHLDAKLLVDYAMDTITKEIVAQKRGRKVALSNGARLKKVYAVGKKQMKNGGLNDELASLYQKRLIDRSVLASSTLGLMEADQRLASLEGQIALLDSDIEVFDSAIAMLTSLKTQLSAGQMNTITGTQQSMLLLTKQAVDARSAFEQSAAQKQSAIERKVILTKSLNYLSQQIAELESSTIGRAIQAKVNVLFVPYGNEANFVSGTALYSCRLTIIWCAKVGVVGASVEGESNAVHPFFGKPIRGFFVEAVLDNQMSATREIMHAQRPPLFF